MKKKIFILSLILVICAACLGGLKIHADKIALAEEKAEIELQEKLEYRDAATFLLQRFKVQIRGMKEDYEGHFSISPESYVKSKKLIESELAELNLPPEGFEDIHEAILELYKVYNDCYTLVTDPSYYKNKKDFMMVMREKSEIGIKMHDSIKVNIPTRESLTK